VVTDLVVQGLGVALDRVLGGGVCGHVGLGQEPEHGRDVDDAPASLSTHVRQDLVHHAHDPEDVGVEDGLGLLDGGLFGRTHRAGAGVVDQDVDPPEPFAHFLDRCGDRGVTGDVEVEERHAVERCDA
jgi:hypothetical protein